MVKELALKLLHQFSDVDVQIGLATAESELAPYFTVYLIMAFGLHEIADLFCLESEGIEAYIINLVLRQVKILEMFYKTWMRGA